MGQDLRVQIDYLFGLRGVIYTVILQYVDESMKQDETFFDVVYFANLGNILTLFVFTSYNVFQTC